MPEVYLDIISLDEMSHTNISFTPISIYITEQIQHVFVGKRSEGDVAVLVDEKVFLLELAHLLKHPKLSQFTAC